MRAALHGPLGALLIALGGLWLVPAEADEVPTCFGVPATVVGTDGPDILAGSDEQSDVIWGGGGDDVLDGGDFYGSDDFPDLVCGGPGDDRVLGSAGDDELGGGAGDDFLDGKNGADVLRGRRGHDILREESINDSDRVDDVLRGGAGNDHLSSGWGQDRMYGHRGDDTLVDYECDGPTLLRGGAGNDHLESWSSNFEGYGALCDQLSDLLDGGRGEDSAKADPLDRVRRVEHLARVVTPAATG